MKIALNIQPVLHSGKSGVGFFEHEMIRALQRTDKSDDFYLQYFDLKGTKENDARVYERDNFRLAPCRWFNATVYLMLWSLLPVPYRIFFKEKPDVTMFFNYYHPPFPRGKSVLVVFDTVVKDFPETMNFKTKFMLGLTLKPSIKRADRIITTSEYSKSGIVKHYGCDPRKITVIPCAADRKKFFPVPDKDKCRAVAKKYGVEGEYYLYLGNIEPRKNISRLIEAYSIALKQRADIPKLVLAGIKAWQSDAIFSRAKELGIDDHVIFTGYVDDDDVPLLMNGAKAFCFPSLYEGFGMPPLEAMACGTPVIVSTVSSLPEVTGECGLKADPYDPDSIARAMLDILDPKEAKRQSEMGIIQAEKFSWDKSAGMLLNVFKELCNE